MAGAEAGSCGTGAGGDGGDHDVLASALHANRDALPTLRLSLGADGGAQRQAGGQHHAELAPFCLEDSDASRTRVSGFRVGNVEAMESRQAGRLAIRKRPRPGWVLGMVLTESSVGACWSMISNLQHLMDSYGLDESGERCPWVNNLVALGSKQAESGLIRKDTSGLPTPDAAALARCRAISAAAAAIDGGVEVGLGSEGSEEYQPFYIAAHEGWRGELSTEVIEEIFGDTLWKQSKIVVEPMADASALWCRVLERAKYTEEDEPGGGERVLGPYMKLRTFFEESPDFKQLAFVLVDPAERDTTPCKFGKGQTACNVGSMMGCPDMAGGCLHVRLFLGLMDDGSLAGVLGFEVWT